MLSSNMTDPKGSEAAEARLPEFSQQIQNEIPFLRRAARRWHRDKPNVDDLVQDVLVQALANAHLWQPGSDLRAWLYTIMRNRFLAEVARSNRSASLLKEMAVAEPSSHASELRLLLRDLGAALRRLPSNQRSAVILIGVQEKSYNEAAQSMGISVGAVRSHLARGRDRLRMAMRGNDTRSPFAARATAPIPTEIQSRVLPPTAADGG